jgi:DNA-binding winged helix-turn-helix (wHTH) protein/tetratricopeptide (TPR) repeat protein
MPTPPSQREAIVYSFGPLRLDAVQLLLFRDGQLVSLSPKAVDVLMVLVRNHGQLVEKEELMRLAWPGLIVEESNLAIQISQLRKTLTPALGADPIATIPRRGYRFVAPVEVLRAGEAAIPDVANAELPKRAIEPRQAEAVSTPTLSATNRVENRSRLARNLTIAAVVLLALIVGLMRWHITDHSRASPGAAAHVALTDKDSVLLADVQNDTGESVFDTTLRQALSIQLEQSPFLTLVSDQQIQHALTLMNQPRDARLTRNLAWELCQRSGSAVVIYGSIANLANQYVLGLRAVNCRTGDSLSNQQVTAQGKDQVLKAVDEAATALRTQLGESLAQVQRYNAPVEQVTTPSFEALEAYSRGWLMNYRKSDPAAAISFFQRAITLDPDFAMAYAALGQSYANLYEPTEAARYVQRAYAFRGRVSERERFYIESRYQRVVTGDLEKARLVDHQWAQVYPRDAVPHVSLALIDRSFGQYEQALAESKTALNLAPDAALNYSNLAFDYLLLNRLTDAKAVAADAQLKNLESPLLRLNLYFIAYREKDLAAAARLEAWAVGQSGIGYRFLADRALQYAHAGQLAQARELSQRAVSSALHAGNKELAADDQARWAVIEALLGYPGEATHDAAAALQVSEDRDTRYRAALAFALTHEDTRAQQLADGISRDFPEDTAAQSLYLPTVRAVLALDHGDAVQAVRELEPAKPYELSGLTYLYPVYVRGQAYLAEHQPAQALLEFRKVLDLPGVVSDDPIGALVHLQIARAYAAQGAVNKATAAYQEFLTLWHDADPGIPVFSTARSELARLK